MEPIALFVLQFLWFTFRLEPGRALRAVAVVHDARAAHPPRLALGLRRRCSGCSESGCSFPTCPRGCRCRSRCPLRSPTPRLAARGRRHSSRCCAARSRLASSSGCGTLVGVGDLLVAFPHAAHTGAIESSRGAVVRAGLRGARDGRRSRRLHRHAAQDQTSGVVASPTEQFEEPVMPVPLPLRLRALVGVATTAIERGWMSGPAAVLDQPTPNGSRARPCGSPASRATARSAPRT